jgi:hypothetical protein
MGNFTSSPNLLYPQPSLPFSISPLTAHIIARPVITTQSNGSAAPTWYYESRINITHINIGTDVSVYHQIADSCTPDSSSGAVIEGQITRIANYNRQWVIFMVFNRRTGTNVHLAIPRLITHISIWHKIFALFAKTSHYPTFNPAPRLTPRSPRTGLLAAQTSHNTFGQTSRATRRKVEE